MQSLISFTEYRGNTRVRHGCGGMLPAMPDDLYLTTLGTFTLRFFCRTCSMWVTATCGNEAMRWADSRVRPESDGG